jgi:hypothetical protein
MVVFIWLTISSGVVTDKTRLKIVFCPGVLSRGLRLVTADEIGYAPGEKRGSSSARVQ